MPRGPGAGEPQAGLPRCFTPVRSPESNGLAEAFVKTFKRDYVRLNARPDAAAVIAEPNPPPVRSDGGNSSDHLDALDLLRHRRPLQSPRGDGLRTDFPPGLSDSTMAAFTPSWAVGGAYKGHSF